MLELVSLNEGSNNSCSPDIICVCTPELDYPPPSCLPDDDEDDCLPDDDEDD